jgi:hypothetical protein
MMRALRHTLVLGGFAAAGLLVWTGTGRAEFIKRDMLMQACTGRDAVKQQDCEGYILGVADTAAILPGAGGKPDVCIEAKVTGKTMRQEVTTFLQGHPATQGGAAPAVLEALKSLYKC